MKVNWWIPQGEYDPAEFPERCVYKGVEDTGEGLAVVIEEEVLELIFTADEGIASLKLSDGGWVEPTVDFRIVP